MKKSILLVALFFVSVSWAQYTITIDAILLDTYTKKPVPYVNIYSSQKDIKAVADVNGAFSLSFDEDWVQPNDTFQIEADGYESVTVPYSKFSKYLSVTDKIYLLPKDEATADQKLTGMVMTDKGLSIPNASVSVKNSFTTVHTDTDGNFKIDANLKDTLVVEFIGMHKKEWIIRNQNAQKIRLKTNTELLSPVMVKGEKAIKKPHYVDTGFGRTTAASFRTGTVITADDIGPQHLYTTDILRGSVAGLFVYNGEGNVSSRFNDWARRSMNFTSQRSPTSPAQPVLILRGAEVQIYYDGFPYYGNLEEIEVRTIDNIVILKSMASTVLYGGRPTILITSKNRFLSKDSDGKVINSALLTTNTYTETVPPLQSIEEKPLYIQNLEATETYVEALQLYEKQRANSALQTIAYYIQAAKYFERWSSDKTVEILLEIDKLAPENPKALKTLAYHLEMYGASEKAKHYYQRIAMLLPNSAQSYRDLALAYKHAGNYQESLDLYVKMLTGAFEGIDFSGIEESLLNEMQQLLRRHRSKLTYTDIPANLLSGTFKYDVRIVVEWNDPAAEFNLQFVNPSQKAYTWEHSLIAQKDAMITESKNGNHMEEFVIDNTTMTGNWTINIENLQTEKTINPTYIKYTVYTNYGQPNQQQQIKLVPLSDLTQKVTLDVLNYVASQKSSK